MQKSRWHVHPSIGSQLKELNEMDILDDALKLIPSVRWMQDCHHCNPDESNYWCSSGKFRYQSQAWTS